MIPSASDRVFVNINERIQFAKLLRQGHSADVIQLLPLNEILMKIFNKKKEEQEREEDQIKQALYDRLKAVEESIPDLAQRVAKVDFLLAAKEQMQQLEKNIANLKEASSILMQEMKTNQNRLIEEKNLQANLQNDLRQLILTLHNEPQTHSFEKTLFQIGQEFCSDICKTK